MKGNSKDGRVPGEREEGARFGETAGDPELEAVLKDLRASVHAWSAATYESRSERGSRAVILTQVPHRALWHRSLVWASSIILTVGVVTANVYQYRQKEQVRQAAIERELEHERQVKQQGAQRAGVVPVGEAALQRGREVDELLARVDRDVARETPSAMEPLASLMDDDEKQ
jgi:hypothetical protein